jgi:hypothetical protein
MPRLSRLAPIQPALAHLSGGRYVERVTDPTPATDEQFRAAINAGVELFKRATDATGVGPSNSQEFLALHGLTAVVIEQVEASLLLIDSRRYAAALSNVRSAFEYALTMQLLHQIPSQLEHFVNKAAKQNKAVLTGGQQLGWDIPDALRDILDADIPKIDPAIKVFEQLCYQFADGKALYVHYRGLCAIVHPSLDAVARYAYVGPGGGFVVVTEGRDMDVYAMLWACAQSVVLALACREDLRDGKPNEQAVQEIAASIGMPSMLPLNAIKHPQPHRVESG